MAAQWENFIKINDGGESGLRAQTNIASPTSRHRDGRPLKMVATGNTGTCLHSSSPSSRPTTGSETPTPA